MTVAKTLNLIERNTGILSLDLDGKNDYAMITDEVGKANLTALASKADTTVNRLVWDIRDHITDNAEADDWAK